MAAKPIPVEETARMKRAKRALEMRKDEDPSFLRPHKILKEADLRYSDVQERGEGSQVDVKSAVFRPNWGFRKQDSVVGSTAHAIDWSRNSLTSPDYKDFVVNGGIGESEALGCQALAVVNAHFQGTLHRARSWERKAKEFEIESQQRGLQIHQLEEQLNEERERLAASQAELVVLKANREKEKDQAIDDYLESAEYKKLMDTHDDSVFPVHYSQGWDAALSAVLEKHPGLFEPSDVPNPCAPKVVTFREVEVTSSELFGEDDALVKAAEDAGTSSKKKVDDGQGSTTQTSPIPSPKEKDAGEEDDTASKAV